MRCPIDLSDLDALVLAEVESLSLPRAARASEARSECNPERAPECQRAPTARDRRRTASAALLMRQQHGRDPQRAGRARSGEEAEGLFDEPLELSDPGGDRYDDPASDGPTAADLLSPEEQAFIARAAGFLSGRPNADLILDRIWSQAIESNPNGLYDPESADALSDADSEPSADASGAAPRTDGWPEAASANLPAQPRSAIGTGDIGPDGPPLLGLAADRSDGRARGRPGPVGVSGKPRAAKTRSEPPLAPIPDPARAAEAPATGSPVFEARTD